ncbi:nucleotide sugar dehydrogenase, partial [Candidatus Bathyarchaeota archaeon]
MRARGFHVRPGDLDTEEKRSSYVVCVVGLGRMGLPTACLWARAGFRVVGADINPAVASAVSSGKAPFEEPGLGELLADVVASGRLRATTDVRKAASEADLIKVIVATPLDEQGRPDYGPITRACREVGLGLRPGALVLIESTVGPGITEDLLRPELEEASGLRAGVDFGLAYSPIRATSGRVLKDLATYPRVLGALDARSLEAAKAFLLAVTKGGVVTVSDIRTAEAVKLFENVYRHVVLALTNELAMFCQEAGIDFLEAARAANTQPYCRLLTPGLVGGHIPKDQHLLMARAEELGVKLRLARAAEKVNEAVLAHVLKLLREALREAGLSLRRAAVAVLGVSYKPDVKNPAGSRTEALVRALKDRCKRVLVYDPFYTKAELEALGYPAASTLAEAVEGANCLLIAVGHSRFRELNLEAVRSLMADKAVLVDAGNVIEPSRALKAGFVFRALEGSMTLPASTRTALSAMR